MYIQRLIQSSLEATLARGKSILLLGPRQAGKTTLVKTFAHQLYINLMDAGLRNRYEKSPEAIISEIQALAKQSQSLPLVIIDEIQKVPTILDSLQLLIDDKVAKFIITGSSARKLRNMLPGRVIKYELQPIGVQEFNVNDYLIEDFLTYGLLPEILSLYPQGNEVIEQELSSYVSLYLEEEIRKEALVRNLGTFGNFLRLACVESGNVINLSKMAQEVGVSRSTISEYYHILEDCMLAQKIEPISTTSSRRKLNKAPKYILFDLGIRRVGAQEGIKPSQKTLSYYFEQFISIELNKIILNSQRKINIHFWRDHAGPEVDIVLEAQGVFTPIEIKWTDLPTHNDCRHLKKFMQEYTTKGTGYILCRTSHPMQLDTNIIALPWQNLADTLN